MRKLLTLALIALVGAFGVTACGGNAPHKAPTPAPISQSAGGSVHPPGWATQPPTANSRISVPAFSFSLTPTLEMYDAIYLSDMQKLGFTPQAVAGYVGGHWPSYKSLAGFYTHSLHLSIAINAGEVADCLDVEPGDASNYQVAGWVHWMLSLGHQRPCVYTSVSNWGSVNADIGSLPIRRWCAWYRYTPGLINGCDAVQWSDHGPQGQNVDQSTVAQSFFGPPPPPPDPYAIFPKTVFPLGFGQRASEHNTVATWDHFNCKDPARREVCKSTHWHLELLRDRIWFVANHKIVKSHWVNSRPRWGTDHLGARFQLISHRL